MEKKKKVEVDRYMRGDVQLVMQMSRLEKLNDGGGFSYEYVRDVIAKGTRTNEDITRLHNKVIAMRTAMFAKTTPQQRAQRTRR